MFNTSAGVLGSAAGTVQDAWSSGGPTFSNYVADISKGILIIIIGGLGCGMALSLVGAGDCRDSVSPKHGLWYGMPVLDVSRVVAGHTDVKSCNPCQPHASWLCAVNLGSSCSQLSEEHVQHLLPQHELAAVQSTL
jgi:hypothetical protein